jgi:hypothetical protein
MRSWTRTVLGFFFAVRFAARFFAFGIQNVPKVRGEDVFAESVRRAMPIVEIRMKDVLKVASA